MCTFGLLGCRVISTAFMLMASHVCLSVWSQPRGEPPRCSRAWRGVLCLGFVSTDGEGMVSEDISCSRIRFVQTRKKASCLEQCGQFWCPRVGAMLHGGCGLCAEGRANGRSVRVYLTFLHKGVCGRAPAECAPVCG